MQPSAVYIGISCLYFVFGAFVTQRMRVLCSCNHQQQVWSVLKVAKPANRSLSFSFSSFMVKGSHHIRKTVKKADNVRFGQPPPKTGKKRTFVVWKKTRKSRQMRFRYKTVYVWGLGYRWDPWLSGIVNPRSHTLSHPTCRQMWHFVVNLSVCIVHVQVIWGPGKIRLKWMNWGKTPPHPPIRTLSAFFTVFLIGRLP